MLITTFHFLVYPYMTSWNYLSDEKNVLRQTITAYNKAFRSLQHRQGDKDALFVSKAHALLPTSTMCTLGLCSEWYGKYLYPFYWDYQSDRVQRLPPVCQNKVFSLSELLVKSGHLMFHSWPKCGRGREIEGNGDGLNWYTFWQYPFKS